MPSPLRDDPVQLAQRETYEVIEAFALERSDVALGESIGPRRVGRRMDGFYANLFEHGVVAGEVENLIIVADHEARPDAFIVDPHGDVPDLLFQPKTVGIEGGGRVENAA